MNDFKLNVLLHRLGLFPKAKPTLEPSGTDGQLKKSLSDTTCKMSEVCLQNNLMVRV